MGRALLLAAVVAVTAFVGTAAGAEAVSPSAAADALSANRATIRPELFSEIATGVARIRVRLCRGGAASGTGFLIGDQVLMTARHVIKGGCSYRVTLGGKSYTAGRVISWYTAGARDLDLADVATLKLDRPAPGYVFSFARRTPTPKTTIAVVGFPLGNPISFNQGPLVGTAREKGVPLLAVRIATAQGSSGSAFLNPAGDVVGILQRGLVSPSEGLVWGVNLVRWWGPQIVKDLCRAYRQGGIPGCDDAQPPPPPPPPPPPAACSNGRDDDADGKVDYPADPGCSSASDADESDPAAVVTPGNYQGATQNGNYVFFTVLPTRALTGFRVNDLPAPCDGPLQIVGPIDWTQGVYPIAADGRFSGEGSWTGSDVQGDAEWTSWYAKFTGYFNNPTTVTGTVLINSELNYQGRHWRCTTGEVRWSATLR